MRILADIRSLQDPAFVGRGIGSHAAFLLRWLRGSRKARSIVGMVDPRLGPLAPEHSALCHEIRPAMVDHRIEEPAIFLSLSPLTHDSLLPAQLLDRPHILPIAVVYDFIPLEHPDRYLADRESLFAYAAAFKWLEAFRAFLPISGHCGTEVVRRLGVPCECVSVTGVALREPYARCLDQQRPPARRPESAANESILFIGGGDPRKNLDTVIAAHAALVSNGRPSLQLVIGGGYPRPWQESMRAESRERCGRDADIRFLGHLSDDELVAWHRHAKATVTASLAEGFSMPVIESIASGGLAVVSDIPVHRELVESPEAIFAPTNAPELAAKLGAILDSPTLRSRLQERQRPAAERFTANAVGSRFERAIDRHAASFLEAARPAKRSRRPAIAFVTPFPPDQSGVADYSRKCVATLAKFVDIDVYTDAALPTPTPGVHTFHPISAAAWLRPDYDAVVAVAGNSHYHTKILDLLRQFGGPCIVHDGRLAELTAWWKGEDHLRKLAERSLGRAVTAGEIRQWLSEPGALPMPFYDEMLEKADPLFVHSSGIQRHTRRLYGVNAVHLPFCVYRDFSPEDISPDSRRAAREALGIPHDRTVVITLGIVAGVKSPTTCVEAVARIGSHAHLYFVGECDRAVRESLESSADAAGIVGRVHFADGWIPERDYRHFIVAADAAIQLRRHFFGGISGALTDCVAAGLPTVANRDLADAITAPHYVARVPDQPSVGEVADALRECIGKGRDRQAHEGARVRFSLDHSFDTYARRLLTELLGPSPSWAIAEDRVPVAPMPDPPLRRWLVDATYTSRSAAGSGVHRVVTRSLQAIAELAEKRGIEAIPVIARDGGFVANGQNETVEFNQHDLLLLPDAYWACGEVWPAVERARNAGAATAAIVYDLIPMQHPEIYGVEGASMFRRYLTAVVAHADVIVTISATVARDLAAIMPQFRFPRSAPQVVPWRLGSDLPETCGDIRPSVRGLFDGRMPGSPYLMLGAIEPRKNHHQVLDAFESLWERPSTGHVRLAIVGRPGFKPEGVIRRIKSDPRFGSRLLLLADLDDAEVDHAYRNARGLVLASIAEGFGLPIVEALRHGQTVIASDLAIHREVGGDACTYFNLSDTCALADAIMEHEREVGDAAAPLRKRVSPATWGEAAARLMDSIGNALGRGTLSDDSARRNTT